MAASRGEEVPAGEETRGETCTRTADGPLGGAFAVVVVEATGVETAALAVTPFGRDETVTRALATGVETLAETLGELGAGFVDTDALATGVEALTDGPLGVVWTDAETGPAGVETWTLGAVTAGDAGGLTLGFGAGGGVTCGGVTCGGVTCGGAGGGGVPSPVAPAVPTWKHEQRATRSAVKVRRRRVRKPLCMIVI